MEYIITKKQNESSAKNHPIQWAGLTGKRKYKKYNEFAGFTAIPGINSGNNCGHDPLNPKLSVTIPYPVEKVHHFIIKATDKMPSYYHDSELLPTLSRTRRVRSEGREAETVVAMCLVSQMDIVQLRVFRQSNLTYPEIAKNTGLSPRRVARAVHALAKKGLITAFQRHYGDAETGFKGMSNGYAISKHLFGLLGLGEDLARTRKGLNKHRRKVEVQKALAENELNQGIMLRQARAALSQRSTNRCRTPDRSSDAHPEMSLIDEILGKPPD